MLSVIGPARLLGWLHVILLSISMAVLLRHAVLFRSLGARLRDVDLLEHGPLAPFVQASFRTALLFVSWWACTAAFHVRWEGDLSLDPLMLSLLPTQALFTVAVFLLPLLGVHKRLREARDAELARVHRAIRGDRVALRASLIGSHAEALSPVDLFLYREQVRSLSTWPFDAAAIVRLALLTAVPVLGWLGGALVERALGVLLD